MISGKEVKCSGSPSYDDTMDMTIFLLFKIRGDTVHTYGAELDAIGIRKNANRL